MGPPDFKISSSSKTPNTVLPPELRKTLEELVKEYKSKNIPYILFEIFEKDAAGKWQLTEVLVEKQMLETRRQHHQSREKADQYRSTGNVTCISGETLLSLAGACFGNGQVGSILTATGQGLGHSRQLLVGDRRMIRVALIENTLQRSNAVHGEATNSKHNSESSMHKAYDRQLQNIQSARDLIKSILGA